MLILRTAAEMHEWSRAQHNLGASIGFVPTMGALHRGHETLLQHSENNNQVSVLSIFVNPTQFNMAEDFEKYPRTFEDDIAIAGKHSVDVVFAPTASEMYPSGFSVNVQPGTASLGMEGSMRPGHFAGVTTVVAKLFNMVNPHNAYFGKKDFQQLAVVKQMVTDLNFSVKVIGIDTVRESDGLALSSRNVRLTPKHRSSAVCISEGLFGARDLFLSGENSSEILRDFVQQKISRVDDARIEYVEVCDLATLQPVSDTKLGAVICVAAWFGDVRLIDNIELTPR